MQNFKQWLNSAKSLNGADKQMSYQSYMSNSAHQREVADLKAAGLNPVLSANNSGASTPVGAMDETANNESSGGFYRIVKKSVDNSAKTANKSINELGEVIKDLQDTNRKLVFQEKRSNIGLPTQIRPETEIKPSNFIVPDPEEIDFGKNAKMISLDKDFNYRWKNNQLSWQDVKDYVSKENGTKWYDSQRELYMKGLSGSNKQSAIALLKNIWNLSKVGFSDYSRNINSKAFKEAIKHLSKSGYNDYSRWFIENRGNWW